MQRNCVECGRVFDAEHGATRYCSARCRDKKNRDKDPTPTVVLPRYDVSIIQSVQARLESIGQSESPLGQLAMRLAEQAAGETGSALAALSREMRAILAEVEASAAPAKADPVDELRRRRDAKRNAG